MHMEESFFLDDVGSEKLVYILINFMSSKINDYISF